MKEVRPTVWDRVRSALGLSGRSRASKKLLEQQLTGRVLGLDISQYQPSISWDRVVKAGYKFCYVRAVMQNGKVDPFLIRHSQNVRKAGLDLGLYLFFDPRRDPEKTADLFADLVKSCGSTLPPAVDVEVSGNMAMAEAQIVLARFLTRLETHGVSPIIYTYPYFWPNWPNAYSKYKLWIAHYETLAPKLPPPWKDWTFWQYAGNDGRVEGVLGPCDMSVFAGSMKDLAAMRLKIDS